MWWSDRAARGGAALCLALLAGCGAYHWVAEDAPAPDAPAIGPVAVQSFANETLEPYLGPLVTATVRARLLERGVVVDGRAARRLSGRITDFSDDVQAFDAAGIASHRRVVITAALGLTDTGRTLWKDRAVVVSAEYPVTQDSTRNRDAKDRALEEAAADLAEGVLLDLAAAPGAAP